jgi:AbiV family abortive infection protein
MNLKDISCFERKIILNVWELYKEAKWLNRLGHYARSYALSHLAFEESAKITVLTFLAWDLFTGRAIASDDIHKIFSSQLFKDHRFKLRVAFLRLPGYDYQTALRQISALDKLKNRSLYSDIIDDEMYKPSDFFGKEQTSLMIGITKDTLQRTIEDIGIVKISKLDSITDEMIESRYKKMKEIFNAQRAILMVSSNVNHVDYLMEIIKTEELFNRLKQLFQI